MTLTGEGQYNINALKEIEADDSFLTLNDDIRGCRISEESHDDCTTRLYLDNMRQKCDCLPFAVASQDDTTCSTPKLVDCGEPVRRMNYTGQCLR